MMQAEIDAGAPAVPCEILGVNGIGHESGNATNCAGRVIPWLQDAAGVDAWTLWGVAYRDVVILDPDNEVFAVYNLTFYDLAVPGNYDALMAEILAAAGP
jgi:hypothetical protein